jgi:Heparinase II/III-like protein
MVRQDNAPARPAAAGAARQFALVTPGHPRLSCTAADLPGLRARTRDARLRPGGRSGQQHWASLAATAEQYLAETDLAITYYNGHVVTFPLPPVQPEPLPDPPGFTAGRYPYWTMLARAMQERLELLAFAALLTGDTRFAHRARDYALALADWPSWTDPTYPCHGQTCLDTAHLTYGMSAAYDLLYTFLTDAERMRIATALEAQGLRPLYADTQTPLDHNLGMLRASALASGAVALLDVSPYATRYLERAVANFTWYLDRRLTSGQQEGLLYTSYSLDHLLRAADQIARATAERSLITHPFINDFIVRWALYVLAPGGTSLANFSDSRADSYFLPTMRIIQTALANGHAGWYLDQVGDQDDSLAGFLSDAPAASAAPDDLAPSAVFPEIGWVALRSGWRADDVLLALVSNESTMGHNHYDQNSFQIATSGVWLAADPGYQDYSPGPRHDFTVRLGHSTMRVDGQGQTRQGGGALTARILSPAYDYVIGAAARAYTDPPLIRFDRHIVFVRPHYFVILDDLAADAPHAYDWLLYNGDRSTYLVDDQPIVIGQRVAGRTVTVRKDDAWLKATFLAATPLPVRIATHPGAESFGPFIQVSSEQPARTYQFLSVVQAGSRGHAVPEMQATRLAGTNILGIAVQRGQSTAIRDVVLFDLSGEGIALAGVTSDARQALVSHAAQSCIERYGLSEGTALSYQGQPLVVAATRCQVACSWERSARVLHGMVETPVPQAVCLYTPFAAVVSVDGQPLAPSAYGYDAANMLVTLPLTAGRHALTLAETVLAQDRAKAARRG